MSRPVLRAMVARSASTRGRRRYIVRSLSAARMCRRLVGMEQPQSPPANRSEPGPRQNDRRARGHRPNRDPPAVEIDPRGAPIDTTTARHMLPPILKYIDQRVAHLARRAEGARVVPICPYPTMATEDTVQTLCDPDGEPLKPARQCMAVHRFDDEMDVVVLNRELENAQPAARRLRKSFLQRRECGIGAQGGQPLPCAQCHVKRMTRMVQRAALMRDANLASRGLTPGARPLATPRAGSKVELDWPPCHA